MHELNIGKNRFLALLSFFSKIFIFFIFLVDHALITEIYLRMHALISEKHDISAYFIFLLVHTIQILVNLVLIGSPLE